jgi:hypothetical protein
MVGVEHQADAGSDCLAASVDQRRVGGHVKADFELPGREALAHVAQHLIDD